MSQEFQILRCYECEKFQVHHVKKAKKWQCKVCGAKQSLKKAYFIGSSRDCRLNVQKLNFQAGMHQFNRMLYESNNSSEALNIDENNSSEIFNSDNFDVKEEESSCEKLHNEDQYCFQNFDDSIPKKKLRYESEVEEFSSHSLLQTNDSKFKFFAPKKNEHTSAVLKGDLERSFWTESKNEISEDISSKNNNEKDLDFNSFPSTVNFFPSKNASENDIFAAKTDNLTIHNETSSLKSKITSNRGFQFILNEAKKQRSQCSYD